MGRVPGKLKRPIVRALREEAVTGARSTLCKVRCQRPACHYHARQRIRMSLNTFSFRLASLLMLLAGSSVGAASAQVADSVYQGVLAPALDAARALRR
jgi:hypothetical protein